MSPLVLVPITVLAVGSAVTSVLARRLTAALLELRLTVSAFEHLETSRVELDGETRTARESMTRLATS